MLIVSFLGEALDASNAPEFKTAIGKLIAPKARMIFDMSGLKFVDSSGLGAILSCLRNLHSVSGDLKLCAMNKPVRALFELVRITGSLKSSTLAKRRFVRTRSRGSEDREPQRPLRMRGWLGSVTLKGRSQRFPVRTRIMAGFIIAAILLAAAAFLAVHDNRQAMENTRRVEHTHLVLSELEALLISLHSVEHKAKQFETSQRIDDRAARQYTFDDIRGQLRNIRTLVADNPSQSARLRDVERRVEDRISRSSGISASHDSTAPYRIEFIRCRRRNAAF